MPSNSLYAFDDLVGRIRLHRQADARPIVVCEGPADLRFLNRVLDLESVALFLAGTRDAVLNAVAQLRDAGIDRLAGVVDRDFDDTVHVSEGIGLPIVCYDNADLEAMIWRSAALSDVLAELGNAEKLKSFGGVHRLRSTVEESLLPLQRLRRANALNGLGLPFDSLKLNTKVDKQSLAIRAPSLCSALWHADCPRSVKELIELAETGDLARCPLTDEILVRGKDCLTVTGVALRSLVGGVSHALAQPDHLGDLSRLASSPATVASSMWRIRLHEVLGT
ncbi:MAG: hypothetical protein ACLQK4_06985 [Acidimicrobiales bacterium]